MRSIVVVNHCKHITPTHVLVKLVGTNTAASTTAMVGATAMPALLLPTPVPQMARPRTLCPALLADEGAARPVELALTSEGRAVTSI